MDREQMLQQAQKVIEEVIEPNVEFEVSDLFLGYVWKTLPKNERTGFGTHFSKAVDSGRLSMVVKCETGKSRHNQYIKRG